MGGGWLYLCVIWVLSVGDAEGSILSVALCVTSCVNVLDVSVCVSQICAQLHYLLNLQRGKWQPCPLDQAETLVPGHWTGLQQPGGRGPGLLEDVPHSCIT